MLRAKIPGIVVLFMLASHSVPAFCQTSAGAILGTIVDVSDALIPGVEVTVTEQGTNQSRTVVTNETGNYRVEPLQSGSYTVTVELPGFRKEIRRDIKVDVDARVRLNFRLEVGNVSETIEVLGAAPVVQTDTSQVGQVIDQRKIVELPLNGRDFSSLTNIAPGAFANKVGSRLDGRGGFVVSGMDEGLNEYLVDGVNAQGGVTLELGARVNVDAVGEFKIQTQNYAAQYGRFAGGHVDAIIKSGTNQFHGNLFAFTRNSALDARNFFDPWPIEKNPEFRRHQYGGTLGGPIQRDKAFFFVGFQGQRQARYRTTNPTIPLPEFWDGNLSRLNKAIRDPQSGQAFPNSQIPKNRISPASLHYRPVFDRATLTSNTTVRNATAYLSEPDNYWSPNAKINYNVSPKHQIIGSYILFQENLNEWAYAGSPEMPGVMVAGELRTQTLALQDVLTISPTIVNELRAGFSRIHRHRLTEERDRDYAAEFGIVKQSFDPLCWGVPQVQITGYSRVGVGTNNCQPHWVHGTRTVADTLSIQKGNHAVKLGGDLFEQMLFHRVSDVNDNGPFSFTGGVTGDAFADFLLGYIDTHTTIPPITDVAQYMRRFSTDWFIQDDWKLGRSLTFNVGFRYELAFPDWVKYGKASWFDPTLGAGKGGIRVLSGALVRNQQAIDYYKNLYPSLIFATAETMSRIDGNNFAPRFGFVWSPGGGTKTAIRGGYGIFYTIYALTSPGGQVPFTLSQQWTRREFPGLSWENSSPVVTAGGTLSVPRSTDPEARTPYYQQWNLGVQRELPGRMVFDIAYTGKKGTKINRGESGNGVGPDINQPINGVKPYPLFSVINRFGNGYTDAYHGLQLRVERRSTRGATVLLSYAFGKLIGNATGPIRNTYNINAERGLEADDTRHRFMTSFVLPLPIGRDRTYFNGMGKLADSFFGGWNLSAIVRANSGDQLTPTVSVDVSGTGRRADRPDLIGDPNLGDKANPKTGWWNTAAFKMPAAGTFGTAGKGILTGPGYLGTDLAILKDLRISESRAAQVRIEMFNAFNQVNFLNPSTVFNSASFGTIGSALPGRQLQGGLKFAF